MKKIIIAACSDNRVIGQHDRLPWHIPADERFLMKQLENGFLLTGRASFESPQGREIFSRRSDVVVVTRQHSYTPSGALVAHSIAEAFEAAQAQGAERLLILGGGEIYHQTIELADELIITEIHAIFAGDAFFPEIPADLWDESHREDYPADSENDHPYSFVYYRRRLV